MRTFLWTFVVLEALCVLGWLLIAIGAQPDRRTPGALVLNALGGMAFVGWALWLLASGG